ncbi:hypothetical protein D3X12_20190 [Pseudomonas protegens]|nr:hypothetical protein CEP86_24685 [Pseudomonas protegens]QEZ52831.1 hypothetical protein D3X12_20190 [Pseudomonas protegens]QEZ60962.1 hypothetical protein D4N38_31615 [Pseudomonas protegens]QEZ64101.1 hypothetical protein D4N37_15515 [Pseudomonas protegens]
MSWVDKEQRYVMKFGLTLGDFGGGMNRIYLSVRRTVTPSPVVTTQMATFELMSWRRSYEK